MFIGHYGIALATKGMRNRPPLWASFIAVSLMDVLCYALVLVGVERFELSTGFTKNFPYKMTYAPWSHGLLSTMVWSFLIWLGLRYLPGGRALKRSATVLALAVSSHYACDWIVHGPDLALVNGTGTKVGLGLWNFPLASHSLELLLFLGGLTIYLRVTDAKNYPNRWGIWILAAVLILADSTMPFFPVSGNSRTLAIASLISTLVIAWTAGLIDQTRNLQAPSPRNSFSTTAPTKYP